MVLSAAAQMAKQKQEHVEWLSHFPESVRDVVEIIGCQRSIRPVRCTPVRAAVDVGGGVFLAFKDGSWWGSRAHHFRYRSGGRQGANYCIEAYRITDDNLFQTVVKGLRAVDLLTAEQLSAAQKWLCDVQVSQRDRERLRELENAKKLVTSKGFKVVPVKTGTS